VPIYEYYCADCAMEFDKLVKLSDANVVQNCPECGGQHTQKKLSTFATSGGSTSAGASASCGGGGRFS
jgi:putative FmdB family regulatory protein